MVSKGALSMQHNHLLCITFIGLGLLSCTCTINALSMLERFNLDMDAGTLTLTFSDQVRANTLDPTRMTLQSSRVSSAVSTQLSNEATTSSANGLVILLELGGDVDRIKASTQLATSVSNTFLSLTASALQDVNGSPVDSILPSNALQVSAFVPDITPPQLISFTLDLELGSLQLFFSEAVDSSTFNPTGITLLNSSPSPTRSFPLSGGSVVPVSLTVVMLTLATEDANNLQQLQDLATSVDNTYLVLTSSTIRDYSANSVIAVPISGAIQATLVIQAVGRPEAVSFPVFDLNTEAFSISFSEPMNLSSIDFTQFTLFSDQSSTASETYTLTGGVLTSSNGSTVAIMLELLFMDVNEIKLLQNLCTSVTNCIPAFTSQFGSDLAGNAVVALSPQLSQQFEAFVADVTPPELVSFDLDMNTGALILTFSEPVNAGSLDPMQITLQSASTGAEVNVRLSNETTTTSSNGSVMMLQLRGDANMIKATTQLATEPSNTFLSFTSSAVQDLYGNPVVSVPPFSALQTSSFTEDSTQPELLRFILDLNIGYLSLSFSEAVEISTFTPTNITILNSSNPTVAYTLTGGDAIAGLTWVRLLLTMNDANQLRQFQDLATSVEDTYLSLSSNTIADYNGNQVAPTTILAAEVIPDRAPEAVSFPVFDLDTGGFSISFSEPMNSSSIQISQFMLFSSCSSSAAETYRLTGGVSTSSDSSTLSFILTSADLNEVKVLQNLCTNVSNCIPAFTTQFGSDLSRNPVVALSPQLCQPFEDFVADSTPPSLISFGLDMNVGTLILSFDEPVSVNTLNPMHITLQAFPGSAAVSIELSSSTITNSVNGVEIVLELQGDADRIKASTQLASSLNNTFLSFTANTVQDISGSSVTPIAPQTALPPIFFISDTTSPELLSFSLDLDFGSLQLSFSEAVFLGSFDPTSITLQSNSTLSSFYTLTGGSAVAVSLTEVILVLTRDDANNLRQLEDLATSIDDTFIALTSSTIVDYSNNTVIEIPPQSAIMAVEFTAVTPPLLKYFQLDLTNTGHLVLAFSELVDPSTFDAPAISLLNTRGIDPTSYSLTSNSSVVFTNSTMIINITISDTDIDALGGLPGLASNCTNTFLSFTSDIIQDIGGNPAERIEPNNSLQAFKVNGIHCNPPAPVMGVRIVIINSTAVGIHWEPAQLEDFSYYIIYYNLNESTGPPEMVRVSRRRETSFTISGLISNRTYAFQITVTVVTNGELVEGEQAENPTIIQLPSDSDPGCPFEVDAWNIQWGFTEPGTSEMQPCGAEFVGNSSRECYENSTWAETDVSSCDSRPFMELRYDAESLFSGENINVSVVLALVDDLAEITVPDTDVTRSLFPSDLNTTNLILTGAVDLLIADLNQTGSADPRQSISIVEVFSNVLDEDNQAGWETLQQNSVGSQALLNNAERYALFVAMATNGSSNNISISRDNIVIQAMQVTADGSDFEDIIFPTLEELVNTSFSSSPGMIRIPGSLLAERTAQSNLEAVPVANVLFRNLEKFLPNSLKVGATDGNMAEARSAIISSQVAVQSGSSQTLKEDPVEIDFILILEKNDTDLRCAFWDFVDTVGNGAWSFEGLERTDMDENNTMLQCSSTHLTSFAILVNVGGSVTPTTALTFITYIGCGVSIVCLLLSIVFFLTAGKNLFQKPHNFIHLNLCIALLLGYALFIGGADFAKNISWLCTTVAALLHYLFLAVFCWMLCEGIMLYLMLVVVFSKLAKRWWFFLLLGWGAPLIFVAIGVGLRLDQYGTAEYCWISTDVNGVIWFFVGPMLAVILINIVFLILVLISLFKTLSGRAAGSHIRQEKKGMSQQVRVVKKLIKASVVILPLLGITWAVGLLAVNENSLVFAYVFTVLNSLQGFFIFFFYVLRDQRLWGRHKRLFRCCPQRASSQVSKQGSSRKGATISKKLSEIGTAGHESRKELSDEKVQLSDEKFELPDEKVELSDDKVELSTFPPDTRPLVDQPV